jgi:uncharacterized membrane protein YfcA
VGDQVQGGLGATVALGGELVDPGPVDGDEGELGRDEHRSGGDEQADGDEAECSVDGGPDLSTVRVGPSLLSCQDRSAMSPGQYLAAVAALALGASVQGVVGFGCNLVAAPLLVLIDPTLVPGPLIAANLALNGAMIRREGLPGAWGEARWPILGQAPGTVAGAAVLVAASTRNLTVVLAVLVLAAVGLSLVRAEPRRTPAALVAAGAASGFMGAIAGIGGPPVALLYQRATGEEIRAAISRFFIVSSAWSVVVLTAFGRFDLTTLARGAVLVPGTLGGYLVSGRLRGHVDPAAVRRAVLGLSGASGLLALVRGLGLLG